MVPTGLKVLKKDLDFVEQHFHVCFKGSIFVEVGNSSIHKDILLVKDELPVNDSVCTQFGGHTSAH